MRPLLSYVNARAASTNLLRSWYVTSPPLAPSPTSTTKKPPCSTSRVGPIVLLRKRAGSPLSDLVAAGNTLVGVMLPYTPLHYLLPGEIRNSREMRNCGRLRKETLSPSRITTFPHFRNPAILVMTSGNLSDEPIIKDDNEAAGAAGAAGGCLLAPQPRDPCPLRRFGDPGV